MARIEKTVFISYRRTDVYTALAVYENLKNQGYDVFFDYRSISSGDFEQIITSNIRARAHFILILTPTALDRCNEPGDWLRREIEFAIDEKRNLIPLFFRGFRFGDPIVTEKLTGKLKNLSRYNGLNVHEDFFGEAMERLCKQFLSVPLETVLHPASDDIQKVVRSEQIAADEALEQIHDVKELVQQARHNRIQHGTEPKKSMPVLVSHPQKNVALKFDRRLIRSVLRVLLVGGFIIWAASVIFDNMLETSSKSTNPPTVPATPIATMISSKDGVILIYVPAGEFMMGSANGDSDEKPVHTVYLDDFWIDKTEVTNKMYKSCVKEGRCKEPTNQNSSTHYSNYYGNSVYDDYPVLWVDWDMAKAYCEWADRRLSTEAEWEKAARGTDGRVYPWGNDSPNNNLLNYNKNVGDTTEVWKFPNGASLYGVLNMAGNVDEWTADWYSESYYMSSPRSNPLGPDSGQYRVLRGGSWSDFDYLVRSTNRDWSLPAATGSIIGFRCAVDAIP